MSSLWLGQITLFANSFEIHQWKNCNGQLLKCSDYPDLFRIVGNVHGGDGKITFALPDLRSKLPPCEGEYQQLHYMMCVDGPVPTH